jgi:hypothetical protein
MTRLRPHGEALWIADGPVVEFYGFRYPTRMAVARLARDALFVWSPIALDAALKAEIDALGPVAYLVSPNKLHHLSLAQWKAAYPAAQLLLPPGLAEKQPGLASGARLCSDMPAAWSGEIDQACFAGSPVMSEIVFFHRASRTALFGDLIENFPKGWFSGWRRVVAWLDGILAPNGGAPREWRLTFFNRRKARQALATVLGWHPQQVVVAHGDGVRENGEAFIRHAFRWLA